MEDAFAPLALRCRFSKCGPIRFISHLDLMRTFLRALTRAGIEIKYSEGFSPHPKFSFALPLSVGTESVAEIADFTLKAAMISKEELAGMKDRLQSQMPAGITILSVEKAAEKLNAIAFCSYQITLPLAAAAPESVPEAAKAPLTVTKTNKKGQAVEKEISSQIKSLSAYQTENGLVLEAVLAAGGENYLKPEALLEALQEKFPGLNTAEKRLLRTGLYRADETAF